VRLGGEAIAENGLIVTTKAIKNADTIPIVGKVFILMRALLSPLAVELLGAKACDAKTGLGQPKKLIY
jgi:hypothetical protein